MKSVNDCEIKFLRKRLEQIGCCILDKALHGLIKVSHKNQRRISMNLCHPSTETPIRHVIFHNLDGIWVINLHSPNFVECHDIPVAYKVFDRMKRFYNVLFLRNIWAYTGACRDAPLR